MERSYQIVISREKQVIGCAGSITVEHNGAIVGKLKNGESITITPQDWSDIISFSIGKKRKDVRVNVSEQIPTVYLSAKLNMSGDIEVIRSEWDSNASYFDYPKTKKRHPILKRIGIVFLVIAFLSIVFGEEKNDGQDLSTSDIQQTEDSTEKAEPTDDEKAIEALSDASQKFADGKYIQAIKVCNDIVENYPETEPALNMGLYLSDQYDTFPHFSAKDIMMEYDNNVVNADKEYTGKVLVISGTISSIGKTNGGNNLCVLLKSDTYFSSVQLNFDSDQEDAVAALSNGQDIEVIGKCTGKSGKVLLVVDGENVMIEDCYIIG